MDTFENDPARGDKLILVDALDRQIGTATKEQAHREGLLHRAFSVVLVRKKAHNGDGEKPVELLVTRRALGKYHSGGLWTNSCCSHPRVDEDVEQAAHRRVREELGVEVHNLREICAFVYRAVFDNGMTEYEYDHVLLADFEDKDELELDPDEVCEYRWETPDSLSRELTENPAAFAPWALTVFPLVFSACASTSR